ncbi:MAG TPA: hypothetical protein VFN48_10080 [Solirubrobacteraceae bacterium]|nr:hypothetical protein [Solirubrobacteraceae bacterium]
MILDRDQLLEVPGILAGSLSASLVAELPAETPPAPWHSNIEMTAWGFRATAASARGLDAGLIPSLAAGGAAFISYLDGAVGPYREILASPRGVRVPGLRGIHGHVPFIAVDSLPSVHGGRANWALPKIAAEFQGAPTRDAHLNAAGAGWQLRAEVRCLGPWVPFRGAGSCAQPWPEGTVRAFVSRFRGRARLALVEVGVDGPQELTALLPGGRHLGLVFRGAVDVGAPA